MTVDHTLAIILAIGMAVLLLLAIIFIALLISFVLTMRRLAKNAEETATKVRGFVENPTALLGLVLKGVAKGVASNLPTNVRSFLKRSKDKEL